MKAKECFEELGWKISPWTDDEYLIYMMDFHVFQEEIAFVHEDKMVSYIKVTGIPYIWDFQDLDLDDLSESVKEAIELQKKELGWND